MEESAYSDMVSTLAKSGDAILASLDGTKIHILHMAIGCAGESFELGEAVDAQEVREELGDMEFFLEGGAQGAELALKSTAQEPEEEIDDVGLHGLASELASKLDPLAHAVLDTAKRYVIYNKADKIQDLRINLESLREGLDGIYNTFSISRNRVLDQNYEKLMKKRFKDGKYSDDAANARADKTESQSGSTPEIVLHSNLQSSPETQYFNPASGTCITSDAESSGGSESSDCGGD